MPVSRRLILFTPLAICGFDRAAPAAESDAAAVATIREFCNGLLAVMKAAKTLNFDQRYQRLAPVVQRAFDLGLMARIAVGPLWTQFNADQQRRLSDAFSRYTISQYAGRFDGYSGERFDVDSAPQANPNGVVVHSKLVEASGQATVLNYLLRRSAGGLWQIIDVYLSGTISELATRRSEFAGVLRDAGPDGLVRMLEQRAASLRSG